MGETEAPRLRRHFFRARHDRAHSLSRPERRSAPPLACRLLFENAMATIGTSKVSVDDIDLGWDDEPSSPPAAPRASSAPAISPASASGGAALQAARPAGAITQPQAV